MTELNPQREQMADESMVRTLAAQAEAIWPQESRLYERYGISGAARILDAGCGTGEITARLAEKFPQAHVLGVDILDHHLAFARERYAALGARVSFANQSVFDLPAADATYDLVACRHVTQAVPHAERVLAELKRVTKPGGWVHLIAEDYGMLHFPFGGAHDPRDFWHEVPARFTQQMGADAFVGRHSWAHMSALGFTEISLEYVVVDTLRVPRATFAALLTAWRDGYVTPVAEHTRFTREEATAYFDRMIADVLDPQRYAVWLVPVIAGRVPFTR